MGLSSLKIQEHIDHWSKELSLPKHSAYRSKWPKYLFHHASLQNACKILEAKALLSRNDIGNVVHDDVAPVEIINSRADAHRYTRLYFRPKNPTQHQVEGIRKYEDLYSKNDPNAHIPMLYMFIFSAASVLKLQSTRFSNGNMQSNQTQFGDSEAFFEKIPFDRVFHEGSFSSEEKSKILAARNAEVLATSPLDLIEHLGFVFCRSEAERLSLIHTCKNIDPFLKKKIRTFTEVGVFESHFAYVRNVDLTYSTCVIEFSPRRDGQVVEVELQLLNNLKDEVRRLAPRTVDPSIGLVVQFPPITDGEYVVRIKIDSHLAYSNQHTLNDIPF
jgi:ssDNA thymidine ADP-ribosyltransferase, DarT